jgi:NAD(P)H-flavin reductase
LKSIKNLDLHIHVTRENIEWYDFGRVEIDSIKADKNTEWYLCGNPKMVSETREKLMTLWYKNIFCEEF